LKAAHKATVENGPSHPLPGINPTAAGEISPDSFERPPAIRTLLQSPLGYESKAAPEAGDVRGFAELIHGHRERKRARTAGMSNRQIDGYYELARAHGAIGGN
jgi:hypothetical protein